MKSDDDQSIIWKIIATILKPDGCLIDGYVYCTKCKLVLSHKFTSLSSYIYRHKCILDLQLNSGQNDAENCSKRRKLNAQEDNVIVLCDDSTNESLPLENSLNKQNECIYPNDKTLWSRFEKIAMHDGSTLKGVVSCRQCKMMLNYDGITEINLNSHICFSMASVSCSGSTDDVDCLNLEKPIEIKTEINMNAEAALGSKQKEFIPNFNETIQIKQEPTDLYVKENSFKDLDHSFIKEEDNSDLDSCEFLLEDNTTCKVKQEFINIQTKSIAKKDIQGNSLGLLDLNKLINHWLAVEMKYDENLKTSDSESLITSIEEMLALNKTEIKLILKENSKNLPISLDFWYEKLTKNNYLLATLYRQRNNELSNLVLGIQPIKCSSPNAKPDIRKILKTLLREFDLDHLKDIVFVSEHNEDTEKALDDDSKSITILKCSSHLFKKVLDSALENTKNLDELIETMNVIVKYLKSSEQEEGEKHLRNLPEFPCNSYYSLLKTLAVNWSKVNAVLANKTEILKINDDVSKTLESLVKLCEKFEYIFKRLRAAQSPSLCFVIPSIQRLRIMCSSSTAMDNDNEVIKSFKMNLLRNIQEIWESHITIWHRAACFLYPPANKEQQEFLTEIKRFCITKILELKIIDSPNKTFETRACNTNNNDDDANDMDFFFPNLFRRIEPQQLTSDNVEEEVNSYSEESVVMCKNFNALQWWNNHTTKYPRLSRVALQILTIPACTGKSTCVQLS